ncbi:MAG: hypothetical protein HOB73_02200 [Planctomycetaceae bacterium]|nr:hypothetical protein [Planctomycetaceae bacterium]MBT5126049.1 hypothetical protein [Planctomycetaceae bacterium]
MGPVGWCCLLLVSCSSREAAQPDNPVVKQNGAVSTKSVQQQALTPRRTPPSQLPATVAVSPDEQTKLAMQPLPIQIEGPAAAAQKNPLDPEKILAQGIRTIQGKHLTLYTDMPANADIQSLPKIVELAMPQWCEYFNIAPEKMEAWKISVCLIQDRKKFDAAGLIPATLPSFDHGYAFGNRLFINEQPSAYYRRHLLLHEATHAFMFENFSSAGPPWYMEGMAELLATHNWDGTQLQLRQMPKAKEDVPYWGRIKIIKDQVAEKKMLMIQEIMNFGSDAKLRVDAYAWSWAACSFLDTHPTFQNIFREHLKNIGDSSPEFSLDLVKAYGEQWFQVRQQWQVFVMNIEYGFDIARESIDVVEVRPLELAAEVISVRADRGWQSTGLRVTAGMKLAIMATGRFVIHREDSAEQPQGVPWESEAGGITIRYHRGQPLGKLLIALDEPQQLGETGLTNYGAVGEGGDIMIPSSGVLYFRVNDSPSELTANEGALQVRVQQITD